ncbi:MAG: acetate kinase [Eubacterium aggregans]|uniref:Acetate kinase n=1 Tax=Eubacterium aggregans TaxID=81409 RepID=A0A1H3XST5_9FIRM|nr:acetate kinase [Eubacterium aggregans]MDD4690778.1 acetate kinase [Eubacterium aggregans]MEA5072726.1 acetate kinase [Eubacterium aggregans]SEA02290.1 acetate kinase [Eubacterium aggregans]
MNVLVINCGSSSLKYQMLDMDTEAVLAKGLAERIGIEGSVVTHQPAGKDKVKFQRPMETHKEALDIIMKALVDPTCGVLKSLDEIDAVGHRTVHGAETFASSVIIDDEVIAKMEDCSELAPLHNPANLIGIRACQEVLPGIPMVGVFDTAFHQTMPPEAYVYPLPYEMYEKYRVRKYGFHGTSHRFVSTEAAKLLGEDIKNLKLISCHLGNGASIAAVRFGKSVDTSMGMTPLAGLMMGTRCGDIDPAIIFYLREQGFSREAIDKMLNNESGVLGISGISSDFRDVEAAANAGNERAILALKIFHYRVRTTIGAYVAAMDGVDGIIFTAGLGENSSIDRAEICNGLKYLGITLDKEKNSKRGEPMVITTPESRTKVMVIPTNEELMIARDTVELTSK